MKTILQKAKEKAERDAVASFSDSKVNFGSRGSSRKYVQPDKDEQILVMNNTTGFLVLRNDKTKEARILD